MTAVAMGKGAYLDSTDAAEYLGYTADRYRKPREAFMRTVHRHGIPIVWIGRRSRFFVRDLEEHLHRLGLPRRSVSSTTERG